MKVVNSQENKETQGHLKKIKAQTTFNWTETILITVCTLISVSIGKQHSLYVKSVQHTSLKL